MNKKGTYSSDLTKWDVSKLAISALLHDIGKIAIPDSILNKPGKLTAEEYEVVKTHAKKGELLIDKIFSKFDDEDMLLYNAKMFALYHHEHWDGNGYPCGLKHEQIPIQGRIMAIVDVYDALTTKRPYKDMFEHEEALKIILEGRGTQFDPLIVDSFYTMRDEIKVINENYRNSTY
jgi:putative two-component system response regulator